MPLELLRYGLARKYPAQRFFPPAPSCAHPTTW